MIDRFRGQHFFLSNFSPSPVTCWGITFPTAEHAYQAGKVRPDRYAEGLRTDCSQIPTPGEAKRWARGLALPLNWNELRVAHMRRVLDRKFLTPTLAEQLIATGDQSLVEVNTWGDTFWGMCNGRGCNILGNLLMAVRSRLAGASPK